MLDAVVRAAPAEGRTVLMASHELEHARAMVTREVAITSGQAGVRHDAAPTPASPQPTSTPENVS